MKSVNVHIKVLHVILHYHVLSSKFSDCRGGRHPRIFSQTLSSPTRYSDILAWIFLYKSELALKFCYLSNGVSIVAHICRCLPWNIFYQRKAIYFSSEARNVAMVLFINFSYDVIKSNSQNTRGYYAGNAGLQNHSIRIDPASVNPNRSRRVKWPENHSDPDHLIRSTFCEPGPGVRKSRPPRP